MNAVDLDALIHRHESLLSARRPWDVAWASLAENFLPTRFRDVASGGSDAKKPLLNDKLVDTTGILAMRTMAAGLHGGMTSPARPWFRLSLEDDELAKSAMVRSYLDEVARRMRVVFHRSNFYNAVHTFYAELGTFGTAFMLELGDFDHGFRFIPYCAGEYVVDTNERQRVDVVFRRFNMTARQLVRQFGASQVPEMVRSAADMPSHAGQGAGMWTDQWTVVHAIYPRNDRVAQKKDASNKPIASVYCLDFGTSSKGSKPHLLRESGFDGFPGFGVRWDVTGNDVYGRSPAMDVLADCKMLQQVGISTIKAIHKSVDPPMNVSARLQSVGLDMTPGGINYVETAPGQAPQAATPLLQIRPEIQAAILLQEKVQKQIQNGLYNDLFRMLLDSGRSQITAREVAAKEEEKLILIGPVLERLHSEMFNPLIDRTYTLMNHLDMLPQPPPDIQGQDIKVEFVSILAQAQKLVSTSAVDQLVSFVGNVAQAFPEALDSLDVDNTVDAYADYLGVEVDIIRPKDERDALRAQRAQAQADAQAQAQAQQGMASMQGLATTARTLSQTPTSATGGTALDALLGGLGA